VKKQHTKIIVYRKFISVIDCNAYSLKRKKPMKPQTETLLDYLTAIAIGVGMAALLVAWWSA
jgi:hypothetical protein